MILLFPIVIIKLIPLCEKANLRDILLERAEALREYLHSFVSHAGIVATNHEQVSVYNDPEAQHRLRDLVVQLLQWQSLPAGGQAGHQRRATIQEHRRQLTRLLQEHPRLHPYVATALAGSYADACLDARDATGLPLTTFPQVCPWTGEQVLDAAFFPEGEPAL